MMIICKDCGKDFEWDYPNKQFCPTCADAHRLKALRRYNRSDKRRAVGKRYRSQHPRVYSKTCPTCGGPMHEQAHNMCKSCFIKLMKTRPPEEHPFWKGGKTQSVQGYIFIYQPSHPRANYKGYVQEHILVWEEAHGKPLPEGWVVHHLNGIRSDNRPRNLVGMLKKSHDLLPQARAKRIQELEALLNNQHQLL